MWIIVNKSLYYDDDNRKMEILYSIKRVKKSRLYACSVCKRQINSGEYALYVNRYAGVCLTHIEERIDKWIIEYQKHIKLERGSIKNFSIKNLLNNEQDLLHSDGAISHYKGRIKQLKELKRFYIKNKEAMLNKSIIANI